MAIQLDDALLEQQRQAYAVKGVDESEPAQQPKKKRKQVYTNGEDVSRRSSCYMKSLDLSHNGANRIFLLS